MEIDACLLLKLSFIMEPACYGMRAGQLFCRAINRSLYRNEMKLVICAKGSIK